ncbi:MAG: tRNA (guanosine(46)-N7)-methyltransferase TrmB [Actinobacteria bacterium]|nr:tRNA (guanosine(46)-N7)-methyltransferase TrmB [Actinomycetota bacterium]
MENGTVKSFKLRGSRITDAQTAARQRLWPTFGIDYESKDLIFPDHFPGLSTFTMEIGFGMGEATVEIAKAFPEVGFLAVDVHQPGIGKLLAMVEENVLRNIRVMDEDAHLILQNMISDNSLDSIHLFFPDPWPKTRHHKRRIVNERFIELISGKLKENGVIHIATDWLPYARWIQDQFETASKFSGGVVDRPDWRPLTRFEGQGIRKDHHVTDMSYRKV